MNVQHPKLVVVNHKEFIPHNHLPTFNSHPIELHLHRISGLSEKFVYFNDDMFIIKKMHPNNFFRNDLPCDSAILNPIMSYSDGISSIINNNMEIINKYFIKSQQISQNKSKYINVKYGVYNLRTLFLLPWKHFVGFYDPHLAISYLKETFVEVWQKEEQLFSKISNHKFRTKNDVSHWVFRYWQLASGKFYPRKINIGKYYYLSDDNEEIFKKIKAQTFKMVCLNDNGCIIDFETQKKKLNEVFKAILPQKSKFEI